MKLSYKWLKDFIDLDGIPLSELADKLTMNAFEVEDIQATSEVLGDNVVLGEIREITKHPDATKLQITKTCIGYNADQSENIQQIVCGASNIAVGQKVPVATIGAVVTHDGSKLEIKKSKIRGVESCGMLCSPDELGLSETIIQSIKDAQGDGIYLLNDPTNSKITDIAAKHKLGTPISKVLNTDPDYVLEVGARSNRGDALSVLGMARELAAVLNKPLKIPQIDYISKVICDPKLKSIKPVILDTNVTTSDLRHSDCTLFYTVSLEGVTIRPSPQWLVDRLNAMGTKSINNVVDISNYVLLELGQPMHFYDKEKITGDSLIVRRAAPGEQLITLEEKEYDLTEVNLVIADSQGPLSLAGVMGGLDSSINAETKNITIEVAIFNPATVRRSSRASGIESESKRRFERGVDKAGARRALERALELLAELAAGETKLKIGLIELAGEESVPEKLLSLRIKEVKRILGIEINEATIIELLNRLEIKLVSKDSAKLTFSIPSFRQNDMAREADLIEEIGRLYGFDRIPAQVPSSSVTALNDLKERSLIQEKIRDVFLAAGFAEAQLSSLIGDSLIELDQKSSQILMGSLPEKLPDARLASPRKRSLLDVNEHFEGERNNADGTLQAGSKAKTKNYIEMDHPLSREHRILRQSLVPGLIQAAARNYAYDKTIDIKLFELGKSYFWTTGDVTQEIPKIAAVFVKTETNWTQTKSEEFFFFKSIVENLYPRAKFNNFTSDGEKLIHPGISATIKEDGKLIGFIAQLHPALIQEWDLPAESYVLELNYPKLNPIKFKPIASTPIIERDITVDSKPELNIQDIQDQIKKQISKDLQNIKLVSIYEKDGLQKSSTFRLKWQSATETLSGELIDQEIIKLKSLLEKELGVTFRA